MITNPFVSVLACIISILGFVSPALAGERTNRGWEFLISNNEVSAIEEFEAAVREDPSDLRAYLGMSYAYELQLDFRNAWSAFRRGLEVAENPHPYIFAAQYTRRFTGNLYDRQSGIREVVRNIIDDPDSLGILRAMGYEMLGGMEERAGDVEQARRFYNLIGSIDTWRLIGPFNNISGSGLDKPWPPELEDADSIYSGADLRKVWWFDPPNSRIDGWVDFARHFPGVYGVFYARCYVKSAEQQRVHLRLGTSGAYRLFLNNELVSETYEEHNNDLDTYITEVTLQAGWNSIVVKCANSKLDRCNFLLRITDQSGVPIPNLESTSTKQVIKEASAQARTISNPFIEYFREQIRLYPERLENYLQLIEAHLRNDQVDDAETVLRPALKKYPDCIALLMLGLDTYQRGSRSDEVVSTIEHINALRPDLPSSLVYTFMRDRATNQLDSATATLERIKLRLPGSIDYYDAAISLARAKDDQGLVVELQAQAFNDHRENITYATAAAIMASRGERGYDGALDVVNSHLSVNYGESGLLLKANILEDAKRYDEWEKVFVQLFELSPAAPGYHSRMSDSYAERKRWEDALRSIELALLDAPCVTWLWQRSATYRRTLRDTAGAMSDFTKAIDCDPANFDVRTALRELRGEPSAFSVMKGNAIDSLIRNAPDAEQLPDEHSVTLLFDVQRVVRDGSRCAVKYEYLVRVLTKDGIDRYKEMSLPGGNDMNVEKAVVIKANGREIPADRSGRYAVFKNLEPGDFVHVRTKTQEYSRGSLAGFFTDDFWVDDNVPVKIARYSLLVPTTERFNWRFHRDATEPKRTMTPWGELFVWELLDVPPIESEEDMPDYDNVAKLLEVSSIPSWNHVVDWYYDIARTKTRSSLDVREKMNELFPPGREYSKMDIISGVYRFITNDIRYSAVPFRQSGVIPQDARDVLVTRIGDCKDVATLCISMLAERNIKAYHVLVKTNTSELYPDPLPAITPFDHVIVLVQLDGQNLFMDLTADNVPIHSVPFADLNAFCLLIKPGEVAPFRLDKKFFTPNLMDVHTSITLRPDRSAHIAQHFTHTGARTQFYRGNWKGANQADLERWLKEGLSSDLPDVELIDYTITGLDTLTPTLEYTLTYNVPEYTMEAADLLIVRVPWYSPYEPIAALSYQQREHPYEYTTYVDTLTETVNIVVPDGYQILGTKPSEVFDNPVAKVTRAMKNNGNSLELKRTAVNKRKVVMPEEYVDYKTFYNNVARSDRQAILLAPMGTIIKAPKRQSTPAKSGQ